MNLKQDQNNKTASVHHIEMGKKRLFYSALV